MHCALQWICATQRLVRVRAIERGERTSLATRGLTPRERRRVGVE